MTTTPSTSSLPSQQAPAKAPSLRWGVVKTPLGPVDGAAVSQYHHFKDLPSKIKCICHPSLPQAPLWFLAVACFSLNGPTCCCKECGRCA